MMWTLGSTGPTSIAPEVSRRTVRPASARRGHQREDFRLEQRLAAGDLDEVIAEREGLGDDLVERHRPALLERVRRVAIAAAQVAGRQADEDAGQAGVDALALEAPVDLVDHERARRLFRQGAEPLR